MDMSEDQNKVEVPSRNIRLVVEPQLLISMPAPNNIPKGLSNT